MDRQGARHGHVCGAERDAAIERDDLPLMQHRRRLQRRVFIALQHHPSRDFDEHNGRHEQLADILNGSGNLRHLRPGREIFLPRRGVDQIHTRSLSRGTVVSRPFRNPRIWRIGCTGMNSTRF